MNTQDVAAALASLLDLPTRIALLDSRLHELDRKLEEVRTRDDVLMPLSKVLGISVKAAQMRLARDPELRKLGVQIGRRTLFKRALVEAYFAARADRAAP